MPAKLTLDDIADLRAYEREREDFRRHNIDLKQKRRISVGPVVTLVFENRETLWFRLQELGRVARLTSAAHVRHAMDSSGNYPTGITLFDGGPDAGRAGGARRYARAPWRRLARFDHGGDARVARYTMPIAVVILSACSRSKAGGRVRSERRSGRLCVSGLRRSRSLASPE